jgi:HSP20 family molecular chaperone IbpA
VTGPQRRNKEDDMATNKDMVKREDKNPERVAQRPVYAPLVDIFENGEEILVVADVPGANKDHVAIRFEKNQLTFEAACAAEDVVGAGDDARGLDYARSFLVPGGVDPERISAELKNGVLRVHLPKQERLKPRQITVTGG